MSVLPAHPPSAQDKDVVAKRLAAAHREADPGITAIFRLEAPGREDDPAEPIKLLEVNPNTTASGIMPVGLSAHAPSGIFFPSIIVEVRPTEWEQLRARQLVLPHGWRLFDDNKQL